MNHCCKFNKGVAPEDGVIWVVDVNYIKVIASVLCAAPLPNVTLSSILPRASILLPPKPMSGYCDLFKAFSVKPILTKHYHTRMSAEFPLSTKILPTSFPAKYTEFLPMLALMTRGSLCG